MRLVAMSKFDEPPAPGWAAATQPAQRPQTVGKIRLGDPDPAWI